MRRVAPFMILVILAFAGTPRAATVSHPDPELLVVLTRSGDPPLGPGGLDDASEDATGVRRRLRELGVAAVEPYYPGVLRRPRLARLADRLRVLRLAPGLAAAEVASRLARDPRFVSAEVPTAPRLLYTPNDPLYPQQWHLPHVLAAEAWDVVRDPATRQTVVGIIDTGLDLDEADLAPSLWVNEPEDLNHDGRLDPGDLDGVDQDGNGFIDDVVGWDFADGDPDPGDTHGHGSAVGACVSAATDNGLRGAALGFGVRLMALKAITDGGALVDGYAPMLYAADHGVDVLNCSWGVPGFREYEQAIVDAVRAEDVVIVAAGGDGAQIVYPAAYDHVFAVSATDTEDRLASFGPGGAYVDICAPGVNILTIWDGEVSIVSGTSFAAGIVSGLVGLVRAGDPGAGADEAVEIIETTAVNIDALNPGHAGELGAGRIDALAAVTASATAAPPVAAPAIPSSRLRCVPNPFGAATEVRFDVARGAPVDVSVFDVAGRRVASLERGWRGPGTHAIPWNARALAPGVYYVRLTSAGEPVVKAVSLVR